MSGGISFTSGVFALAAAAVGSLWLTPVVHPRLEYPERRPAKHVRGHVGWKQQASRPHTSRHWAGRSPMEPARRRNGWSDDMG